MIYLPLYSSQGRLHVPNKSGLNQWNAHVRPRNFDEVYIPIPIRVHDTFPGFLPARDTHFALILPNDRILIAKVCQDNSKALMSHPNSDLGEWILRYVLGLQPGTLATYPMLVSAQIDSVCIIRLNIHDNVLMSQLATDMDTIFRTRNHNIFNVSGRNKLSDYEIYHIFQNIVNRRLYYRIDVAPFGSYQNQF